MQMVTRCWGAACDVMVRSYSAVFPARLMTFKAQNIISRTKIYRKSHLESIITIMPSLEESYTCSWYDHVTCVAVNIGARGQAGPSATSEQRERSSIRKEMPLKILREASTLVTAWNGTGTSVQSAVR